MSPVQHISGRAHSPLEHISDNLNICTECDLKSMLYNRSVLCTIGAQSHERFAGRQCYAGEGHIHLSPIATARLRPLCRLSAAASQRYSGLQCRAELADENVPKLRQKVRFVARDSLLKVGC